MMFCDGLQAVDGVAQSVLLCRMLCRGVACAASVVSFSGGDAVGDTVGAVRAFASLAFERIDVSAVCVVDVSAHSDDGAVALCGGIFRRFFGTEYEVGDERYGEDVQRGDDGVERTGS